MKEMGPVGVDFDKIKRQWSDVKVSKI